MNVADTNTLATSGTNLGGRCFWVAGRVIEREEVVALLFNVSDIVPRGRKKLAEAEKAEFAAQRARMLANAQRTRELAERAQAKLDAQASQR